jgi:malonyl-CoA O-methyltransferase
MHISRSFSNAVSTYDDYARIQDEAGSLLLDYCTDVSPKTILEVGGGTGVFTQKLVTRFSSSAISSVDLSSDMVRYASKRPGLESVGFCCDDILRFSPCKTYDLIVSNATLHWVSPQLDAFQNIRSLLCDRGTFVFTSFGPRTFFELGDVVSDFLITSRSFPGFELVMSDLASVFERVTLERKVFRVEYPDLITLLRSMKYTGTNVQKRAPFWTPGILKKLEEHYLKKHGRIWATYEIFFAKSV